MTALNALSSASAAAPNPNGLAKDGKDARAAAEAFEAIILRQMLATMRQARLADDVFGSSATDNFRELADARTADMMATQRQFGIADMVEKYLRQTKGQEHE